MPRRRPRPRRASLVGELLLVFSSILAVVALAAAFNLSLFRQIGDLIDSILDRDVARLVANAELSRDLSRAFAEARLLVDTFTEREESLGPEGERLAAVVAAAISSYESEGAMRISLVRFRGSLEGLIVQCGRVVAASAAVRARESQLGAAIAELDRLVAGLVVERLLDGREYELQALEEAGAAVPELRSLLGQVALQLERERRAYLGTGGALADCERRIKALFAEIGALLPLGRTAGDAPAARGRRVAALLGAYEAEVAEYHRALGLLGYQVDDFQAARAAAMAELARLDEETSRSAERMRGLADERFGYARDLAAVAVAAVIAALLLALLSVVRITRPIARLTRSAAAIAAGDFDVPIEEGRGDEVGRLALAFAAMRDAIHGRIAELRTEIEERKRAGEALRESEERLQESLAEKEALLRELYHRTKNNRHVA